MMAKITKCIIYKFTKGTDYCNLESEERSISRYDTNGLHIERLCFQLKAGNSAQQQTARTIYRYKNGRLVAELHYKPIDHLRQKELYRYDNNSRPFYSNYFYASGQLIHENFYRYDNHGRRREWLCRDYDLYERSICRYHDVIDNKQAQNWHNDRPSENR